MARTTVHTLLVTQTSCLQPTKRDHYPVYYLYKHTTALSFIATDNLTINLLLWCNPSVTT